MRRKLIHTVNHTNELPICVIDTPNVITNNLIGLRGGGRERLARWQAVVRKREIKKEGDH